jgi:aminoglycoside phosphotransferase (APT) family kinase protein
VTDAQFRERLRSWLEARWTETFGPSSDPLELVRLDKLSKGQSSDLVEVACRAGPRIAEYVLRLEPRSKQLFLQPDVLVEAATLKALENYPRVPAPKIWWVEADDAVLGAPFFVMSRVEGRVPLGRPSLHLAGMLTELTPDRRERVWRSALEALVAVHAVDWRRTHAFLEPKDLTQGYLGAHLRQLADWYAWTVRGREFPITDAALEHLFARLPEMADDDPVLVWNDARVGNMIFGPDDRVAAVIDWEGPTIGPAAIDVGYWLMMDEFHAEAIGVPRLEGWPSAQHTLAQYETLAGRRLANIDDFIVLGALFIATTLIRQADIGVEQGRLAPNSQMGHANSATQIIARRLGLPVPELAADFAAHRQLERLPTLLQERGRAR